jgi:transglutaminase-like putative cysteine protease
MTHSGRIAFPIAACAALSCATGGADLPASDELAAFEHAKGPATVLLDEEIVRFTLEDGAPVARVTSHRQTHIRGERGQHLRNLTVHYSQTFSTVEEARVVTRTPAGDERVHGIGEARDVPIVGYVLYSDHRALQLSPPPVPPGSVADTLAVERLTNPELFGFTQIFGGAHPTETARLVVEAPAGWLIESYREIGLVQAPVDGDGAPRVETLPDGGTRTTWERAKLEGRKPISRGLSVSDQGELVAVRLKRWVDADGAAHDAPADVSALSAHEFGLHQPVSSHAGLERSLQEALAGVPADAPARVRAAHIYAWTRDNVRYCAIEVGMGGWVPHAAGDTDRLRYGDCKDKANLLRALLASAKIDSRIATIYASQWPEPYRLPVLAMNFNHAILVVDLPDGPVVVDPTSRATAFGDLPDVDEDRFMLPLSDPGAALTDTPRSSPERNVSDESYELTIDADGRARGTFRASFSGELADDLRTGLLAEPATRHDELVADRLRALTPDVVKVAVENAAPPTEVTPVVVTGEIKMRATRGPRSGGPFVLRAWRLFDSAFPTVDDGHAGRWFLGYRRTVKTHARIALPAGVRARALPPPQHIDSPWGTYDLAWTQVDATHLQLERTYTFKERFVEAGDVGAYRVFAGRAGAADVMPIFVDEGGAP